MRPKLLKPLCFLWTKIGFLLHHITNPIIMGLLFYCIITPAALLLKFNKKNLLKLKFEPASQSYWIVRLPPEPGTLEKQF